MHTMAVGHVRHTACAYDPKLKSALKTQPFLGIRAENDMKNVKCIEGKKKKVGHSRYSHISCPVWNMTYRNMNRVNAGKKGTR